MEEWDVPTVRTEFCTYCKLEIREEDFPEVVTRKERYLANESHYKTYEQHLHGYCAKLLRQAEEE